MPERDYPEGHPSAADYDPKSEAARNFTPAPSLYRDYPLFSPHAPDTTAPPSGTGYEARVVDTLDSLRPGCIFLDAFGNVHAACPLHGDRHVLDIGGGCFDAAAVTYDGKIQLSCGKRAQITHGVWALD